MPAVPGIPASSNRPTCAGLHLKPNCDSPKYEPCNATGSIGDTDFQAGAIDQTPRTAPSFFVLVILVLMVRGFSDGCRAGEYREFPESPDAEAVLVAVLAQSLLQRWADGTVPKIRLPSCYPAPRRLPPWPASEHRRPTPELHPEHSVRPIARASRRSHAPSAHETQGRGTADVRCISGSRSEQHVSSSHAKRKQNPGVFRDCAVLGQLWPSCVQRSNLCAEQRQ